MTLPPNSDQPENHNDSGQPGDASQQQQPQQAPQVPQAPQQPQPTQQPQQYGAPQPPQAPQYGAPQQPQQPPQYGSPQAPQYGAPQQPQAPQYGAPQQPQYAAPQQPYAAPAYQPQYGAPQYASAIGVPPGPGGPYDGAAHPDDLSRPLYGATFGQAIKRFFRSYVKFDGRASRSEFWFANLFIFLVTLIPAILYIIGAGVMATSATYNYSTNAPSAGGVALFVIGLGLLIIVSLGMLLPSLAISWRRLHDGNFAGPFYFLSFIPYVGGLVLIVFMVLPSKAEGRRFDRF